MKYQQRNTFHGFHENFSKQKKILTHKDAVASMLALSNNPSNNHFEEKSEYFHSSQISDEDEIVDRLQFDMSSRSRAESEDRKTLKSQNKSSGIVPVPK